MIAGNCTTVSCNHQQLRFLELREKRMKRAIIIFVGVAALAVLVFFGYQRWTAAQASQGSQFQTVAVTRGNLTASVGGTGTVQANQTAVIAWQLTGRVSDVRVAVGENVETGSVLSMLDEKSLPQSVILARADLITAQRNLDQLLNSDVARAQANQALILAQKEFDDAMKKRESKNYDRATKATIDEARANLVIAEDGVKRATELYDRVDGRLDDDPVKAEGFSQLAAARKVRDRARANLNYLLGTPDDLEVAEADARVTLAEANLKDAEREWARLQDGADPKDVEAARSRISALEATLGQVQLEAPFAGTITEVDIKSGDQAAPGNPVFRLDDLSRLLVQVQITEVDINRIQVDHGAIMSFDAIPDKDYSGKVVEVARIGTINQGVVNFTITIELDNFDGAVRPGMTAAVNIVTDLLEDVLLIPNRAVRLREGNRIVYVLRDSVPEIVEVELGLSSDTQSQLVSGDIREGDLLVLNPPVQFQPPGGRFN
jgi:HlyD family secretion protein